MKVLYIDCFGGFTSSMLLGALTDMGASAIYTSGELAEMGFDADIVYDKVCRGGIEAVYAYAKCHSREQKQNIKYESVLSAMCDATGENFASSENICTWAAVLSCIDSFGAEKIICSPLTDGSGIDTATGSPIPTKEIMELAVRYKIPLRTTDVPAELISCEGAVFLGENADEFGMLPQGTILCVGYGAGEETPDGCINMVRCVLTEAEEGILTEKELEKLFEI